MNTLADLAEELKIASDAYYNNQQIMTDAEFDAKLELLKRLDPNNEFLKQVGAPAASKFTRVKHDVIHGSQHKVNSETELRDWISKKNYHGPFLVQEKLDGITIVLKYQDGSLVSAATRGDGIVGEEIYRNAINVENIKTNIPGLNATIRGEVVLPKSKFAKHFNGYKNERNSLSIIRSDEISLIKHFKFIPFDLVGEDFTTESGMNKRLIELFGTAVASKKAKTVDEIVKMFDEYHNVERNKLDHLIDGLIIRIDNMDVQKSLGHTDNRPNGQIAFKFPPEIAITDILDIEWGMGITGRLGATAILKPVDVNGVTIKRCTLNNIDWMQQMDVGAGDKVQIGRMNDVIPGVIKVISRVGRTQGVDPYKVPKKCPCCAGALATEGVFLICPNLDCSGVTFGSLMRWVISHSIMGMGAAHLREMITQGFDRPHKFYTLTEADLVKITGSEKVAKKLIVELNKTKTVNLDRFLYGLNVDALGNTNSRRLAKKFDTLDSVLTATADDIAKIDGIKTNADKIVQGLKDRHKEIQNLRKYVTVKSTQSSGPLAGCSICVTGEIWEKRPTVHQMVLDAGGEIKTSVGKGLTFLVTDAPNSGSAKNKKAQSLGVKIIDGATLKSILEQKTKWKDLLK